MSRIFQDEYIAIGYSWSWTTASQGSVNEGLRNEGLVTVMRVTWSDIPVNFLSKDL